MAYISVHFLQLKTLMFNLFLFCFSGTTRQFSLWYQTHRTDKLNASSKPSKASSAHTHIISRPNFFPSPEPGLVRLTSSRKKKRASLFRSERPTKNHHHIRKNQKEKKSLFFSPREKWDLLSTSRRPLAKIFFSEGSERMKSAANWINNQARGKSCLPHIFLGEFSPIFLWNLFGMTWDQAIKEWEKEEQ